MNAYIIIGLLNDVACYAYYSIEFDCIRYLDYGSYQLWLLGCVPYMNGIPQDHHLSIYVCFLQFTRLMFVPLGFTRPMCVPS